MDACVYVFLFHHQATLESLRGKYNYPKLKLKLLIEIKRRVKVFRLGKNLVTSVTLEIKFPSVMRGEALNSHVMRIKLL